MSLNDKTLFHIYFSYLLAKDKVEVGIKQGQIQAESEAWLVHWLQTR